MSRGKFAATEGNEGKSSLAALAEATAGQPLPSAWTLPSGEDLLNYALKGGFLAPALLAQTLNPAQEAKLESPAQLSMAELSLKEKP